MTERSPSRVEGGNDKMDRSPRGIQDDEGKTDWSPGQIRLGEVGWTEVQGGHAECAACEA